MASPLTNPNPTPDAGHVPITEEFDSFKRNLPSPGPVAIAMVLVALVVGAGVYFLRHTPVTAGTIDQAFAVNLPDQHTVLATVQLTVKNISSKPVSLKNVAIRIRTPKGEFSDNFAAVADFERYFQAYPELRQHSIAPLARDLRIAPGQQTAGTVIVSFPVSQAEFDARQVMAAILSFYDHRPVEIRK